MEVGRHSQQRAGMLRTEFQNLENLLFPVPRSRGNSECTPLLHKSRQQKGAEIRWNVPVQSYESFFTRTELVDYGWDKCLIGVTEGLAAIIFSVRYVG